PRRRMAGASGCPGRRRLRPALNGGRPDPGAARRWAGFPRRAARAVLLAAAIVASVPGAVSAAAAAPGGGGFPPPLESYGDSGVADLWSVLRNRIELEPLNLWATGLFLGAVVNSFFTHKFRLWSH